MKRPIHAVKALISLISLIRDPNRLGEVFNLGDNLLDALPPAKRQELLENIERSPGAKRALAEKPRLGAFDLSELAALPAGTLGQVFAEHMRKNDLDPGAIPTIPATSDLDYFRAHLYETHDVWHAVTGFDTDVAGELGLQAFYLAQMPLGLAAAILGGSFFNTIFFAMHERNARMDAIVRGWVLGTRAKPFFGVRWAEMWTMPMTDVRRRLGVDLAGVHASLTRAPVRPDRVNVETPHVDDAQAA